MIHCYVILKGRVPHFSSLARAILTLCGGYGHEPKEKENGVTNIIMKSLYMYKEFKISNNKYSSKHHARRALAQGVSSNFSRTRINR